MADSTPYFVQFPHPGGEHRPATDDMPWNTGDHARKFLIAPGRYVDSDGRPVEAELVFWGEWEPPSRVERRWPPSGQLPRVLHRPHWVKPTNNAKRQNTDPWVFGDRMIYSNCKQLSSERPNSMQRLTPGSVICFGSKLGGEFCVDTVFVVASAKPWKPAAANDLNVGEAFKTCVAASIMTKKGHEDMRLILYRGATFGDPVDGMFSFVPARRENADDPRFPRPPLRLDGLINPASGQAPGGSKWPLAIDDVRSAWETVHKQVTDAGLVLAVHLDTPRLDGGNVVIPGSSRQGC